MNFTGEDEIKKHPSRHAGTNAISDIRGSTPLVKENAEKRFALPLLPL